ncbi:hypothetical protein [Roseibacillus ishigakijimensis]|uniref:Uncharacterized protein n=1 Tax=Roseibacillus ishigakijimensis TaxID=454146 RepID=A0A934RVC0_9BACT|nr:hypothetical protein [Roseibacillus ishigakijimensis]MBK1835674.1 hypothetical protein [Roseibacillus ishigakijimensis]
MKNPAEQLAKLKEPDSKNFQTLETCPTTPPEEKRASFAPEGIFYLSSNGHYLVDTGKRYSDFARKKPVQFGLRRYLEEHEGVSADEAKERANHLLDCASVDRAVDWCGSIAGYKRGLRHDRKGLAMLIMEGPDIPAAIAGECPTIKSILSQAFPEADALNTLLGWLKGGVAAIRSGIHHPAPMLVLAGEVNAGKSLLAWIVQQCFGGRVANPATVWTGNTIWNDDLLGSELLCIDDNQSATDIRSRKNFGARFKEAVYASEVNINTRNRSTMSLRPVWRVLVCCNQTPENLSVIPPLDSDTCDKIALLHFKKATLPVDTSTPEGKEELQHMIRSELPAFLHHLEEFTVPEHLKDSRAGVVAWKDPELVASLHDISPEGRLETMIHHAMEKGFFGLAPGESQWMAAMDVENILTERENPVSQQAKELLKHDTNCGRYLSRMAESNCQLVTEDKTTNGRKHYLIHRPGGGEVGQVGEL